MPSENSAVASQASSPEQTSDGVERGSGNLSAGQAAAKLFANVKAPVSSVAEETTPEEVPATEEAQPPVTESEPAETETPAEEQTPAEEPETEGEDDSVLSPKSSLDAKTKERIQRRIDKEVGRRKALETRNAEMEARLNELEASIKQREVAEPPPAPIANGPQPLANISDFNQLGKLQQQAKEAVRWAEEQLDREDLGDGVQVGNEVFDRPKLKAIVRQAKITLEDHIPARNQFLVAKQQAQQLAHQEFPFLKDRSTPEYQQAQAAMREYPWLANLPNADWIVGVQIEGMKAIEARKAAAKAKAEAPTKPKVAPPPPKPTSDQTAVSSGSVNTSRVPVGTAAKQNQAIARQKISEKGGVTAAEAAAYLLNNSRTRNSR